MIDTKRGYVGICNGPALGTIRVWSGVVKEQRVYGGRLNIQCAFFVKAESSGY